MNKISLILLSMIFVFCSKTLAFDGMRNFDSKKRNYTFSMSFKTDLHPDTLLDLLYDFSQVVKYSSDATTMRLINKDSAFCEVEVEIRYLFYTSKSVYLRRKDSSQRIVTIDLERYWQNSKSVPGISQFHGIYRITTHENKNIVKYEQKVTFNGDVSWIIAKILKGKLYDFSDKLFRYIDKKTLSQRMNCQGLELCFKVEDENSVL